MEYLLSFLAGVHSLFTIPLNVYGFVFSFWDVFIFSVVGTLIFKFIGGVFNENS